MKSNFTDINYPEIISMEIQNGRAVMELSLPDSQGEKGDGCYLVYLWDAKGLPAFCCAYPMGEEEPCMIQLIHPHLWEGTENPYLYRLEVYAPELIYSRPLAIRSLREIPGKGSFLNDRSFASKCVYYNRLHKGDRGEMLFWEELKFRLQNLVKLGANTIILGSGDGLSSQEKGIMQEYCDRIGLILQINDNVVIEDENKKSDTNCVLGKELFDAKGLPTDVYYHYKARWGREPFVYISSAGPEKQSDGSYRVLVYSNCKKVALLVNGAVFGFQEDGPEFVFQDIPIKGFPVSFVVEAGECSMSLLSMSLPVKSY